MSATSPVRGRAASVRVAAVRAALVVLAVLCLAAAFGPLWLVRAGLVLAVLAGAVGAWSAARSLAGRQGAHTEQLRTLRREHGAAFTLERTHNAEVVEELTTRVTRAQDRLRSQRVEIRDLSTGLGEACADRTALTEQLHDRDTTIATRDAALQQRQAELVELAAEVSRLEAELAREVTAREQSTKVAGEAAQVHGLPRRRSLGEAPARTVAS